MGVPITMPQMGVSVAEGTLVKWHKAPGDWVEADELLLEISTDKIDTEVPAPASGRVGEIRVGEGATVEVGTVLATIETEALPAPGGEAGPRGGASPETNGVAPPLTGPPPAAAPPVSPVVARLAAEHGIDLSALRGTGEGGRVTKKDVLAHVAAAAPRTAGAPLSPMRRQIAEHMVRSLHTAAHCTSIAEVDMSGVDAARGGLSYLPWVAHALVGALREHPALNATLEGDLLTVHEAVHLGVAVSLGDDGLIVPVVRDAHELTPEGIAERVAELAARARSGRLDHEEVGGGTFTITNPGRHGTLMATPIINQPQVAILDLEAVVRRPVVVGGDAVAIRPMAYLCLSWDHRALDGVMAARFLGAVKDRLEAL